jgi:GT2 family glycosyltransferase
VLENTDNRGFPAATNQGLREARGDLLVLLNNDVLLAPGWLSRLAAHVEDHSGLVGPVTNRIGNEAEIPVDYTTWGGFQRFAARRALTHAGRSFPIHTLTMFCLAMTREAYEALGPLDEGFGIGTLEDDDYAMRARRGGVPLRCAEDVVVHHFGESSFGELVASGERDAILAATAGASRRSGASRGGLTDAAPTPATTRRSPRCGRRSRTGCPPRPPFSSSAAATTGCSSSEPRGLALPAG